MKLRHSPPAASASTSAPHAAPIPDALAKRVIEEIGNPGETYRIIALDAPPVELACKARVTVAEIVRQPPQKPASLDDEEESEEENEHAWEE